MRWKLVVGSLAVLALGVAGCGSSSSPSTSSSPSRPPTTGSSAATGALPVRIYRLSLTGRPDTPPGAPNGSGVAVIAVHGSSMLCWRFAHLHGFINATAAHIQIGAKGKSGAVVAPLSTGPRLRHGGCVQVNGALVKAIERNPHGYYVSIHSTRYPNGAVRAQL